MRKKIPLKFRLAAFLFLTAGQLFSQQRPEILFYYVDTEKCFKSFRDHVDKIAIVAPQVFEVDEDGVVWGSVDPRVIETAEKHGVAVMPLIKNPNFDQQVLHKLLVSTDAKKRAISSMVELCRRGKFLGIQFDFENVNLNDKDAFTEFCRETAAALHEGGFQLSAAIVHRPDELPGPTEYHAWLFKNWRAGYDLEKLAGICDFLSVMTYSEHTRRTTPGPNAAIPWVTQVVEYFLKHVPPEKLSLGIPSSSMHWYTALDTAKYYANARSWSEAVDYERAMALIERGGGTVTWDSSLQVEYSMFENGGLLEYVFLENERSFKAKYQLMNRYKLRGISVWVLGSEDPAIWEVLK